MEPRPQRPRPAPPAGPHHGPAGHHAAPGQSPEGHYEEYDEQPYIAPPRTEYDYSPLDLAPPGQRRRRQFVAAAIGGLAVLLLVTVGILAYLLLNDDDDGGDPNVDIAALATENAATRAALDAESTSIAEAGANQTATAEGAASEDGEGTAESESAAGSETDPTSEATEETSGEEATEPAGDGEETAPTATTEGESAPSDSSAEAAGAGPDVSELEALLPAADAIPATLDSEEDTSLDQAGVVAALGSSRTVEQNLERWGWSGNVGRAWSASDPEALEPGATSNLTVSLHGFNSPESAAEAFTFYTEVLASAGGYEDADPPVLGETSRLLVSTDESGGTVVALYVQQGNVLYRFGGYASAEGDPLADVTALAEATLATGE